MTRLAYALESRLPRELADLVGQFIDPLSSLPPQLARLSRRWGRIVVARVCGERLSVPLFSEKEALTCEGVLEGSIIKIRWVWQLSVEEKIERELDDYDDDLTVSSIITVRQERRDDSETALPCAFEELVAPVISLRASESTVKWLADWSRRYNRPWPFIDHQSNVHPELESAWGKLCTSEISLRTVWKSKLEDMYGGSDESSEEW
jgi:hypothetical protein